MANLTVSNYSNFTQPRDISVPVGISYMSAGVIFIPLQLVCAYLIHSDHEMQNPTYRFMVALSVYDAVELIGIGLYAGIVLITKWENDALQRLAPVVVAVNYYGSCFMLVLVSYSRWIAVTRPEKTTIIFKPMIIRILLLAPLLLLPYLFYCYFIGRAFFFMPIYFTWAADLSLRLGQFLHWSNFVVSSVCVLIEASFNVLSLAWVDKMRKSIGPLVQSSANQRREIKLLLQSVIIGVVFAMAEIMFTVAVFKGSLGIFILMQVVWTCNHCINPLVYLAMNIRLRRRFLAYVTCGKRGNAVATIPDQEQSRRVDSQRNR